jgi:hypothetical protein
MLTLIDSGCGQHQSRQWHVRGWTADLIERLVPNLALTNPGYRYICEHGQTHWLTIRRAKAGLKPESAEFVYKGPRPLTTRPS